MMDEQGKNSTEELLRQKLEDFRLPVEDSVFENIQSEINKPPVGENGNRKRLGWILLALLLLVGIIITPVFISSEAKQRKEKPAEENITLPQSDFSTDEQPDEVKSDELENTSNSISNQQNTADQPTSKKKVPASIPAEPDKTALVPVSGNSAVIPASVLPKKTNTNPSFSSSEISATKPGMENANSAENTSVSINSDQPDQSVEEKADLSTPAAFDTEVYAGSKDQSPDSESTHLPEPAGAEESPQDKDLAVNPETSDMGDTLLSASEEVVETPKENVSRHSRFSIVAQGGVGYSYRSLRIEPNQDLEAHKDSHERAGLTYNYSLGVRYHFRENMYLATGLGYASFSEHYDFHHDVISHTTVNTYNYLQVPLIFGLRIWHSNKLNLYGQLGASWNSLLNAQSSWVDPHDLKAVSHTNSDPQQPFQDNTFEGIAGFDLAFSINPKWRIHLMPQAGIFLNSVYLQSTQLEQKPYAGSINLGISRRF